MNKTSIDLALEALAKALQPTNETNIKDSVVFNVDDTGSKGFFWAGNGYTKQFIFVTKPDRFFVSESLDLGRNKDISINGVKVLSESELGAGVVKSSLKEVGRLNGLIVDGSLSINQYLIYDANTDRLGIGTEDPKAKINIVDQNVDIIIGASDVNVARIGTYNSASLEISTDNTARITIQPGGNIILGSATNAQSKVSVIGTLAINVNNTDSRASLHVNGPIKFNECIHLRGKEIPTSGYYSQGDIVWNESPTPGHFAGWVCTRSGAPGLWSGFGRIE